MLHILNSHSSIICVRLLDPVIYIIRHDFHTKLLVIINEIRLALIVLLLLLESSWQVRLRIVEIHHHIVSCQKDILIVTAKIQVLLRRLGRQSGKTIRSLWEIKQWLLLVVKSTQQISLLLQLLLRHLFNKQLLADVAVHLLSA